MQQSSQNPSCKTYKKKLVQRAKDCMMLLRFVGKLHSKRFNRVLEFVRRKLPKDAPAGKIEFYFFRQSHAQPKRRATLT